MSPRIEEVVLVNERFLGHQYFFFFLDISNTSASFAGILDSAVGVLGLLIVIHVFLCKNIHKLDFFLCERFSHCH